MAPACHGNQLHIGELKILECQETATKNVTDKVEINYNVGNCIPS